jgi:hypothetical protein
MYSAVDPGFAAIGTLLMMGAIASAHSGFPSSRCMSDIFNDSSVSGVNVPLGADYGAHSPRLISQRH